MRSVYNLIWLLFILLAVILVRCTKSDNPLEPIDINVPTAQNYGLVLGRVKSQNGAVLANVTVRIQNKIARTNDQGWFSISDLTGAAKVQASFTKAGYIATYKIVDVTVGQSSFIDAVISQAPSVQTVSGSNGGTVNLNGGAQISFTSLSFVDDFNIPYAGTVNVTAKYFDPTSTNYNQIFPGNFNGVSQNGSTVLLQSYGYVDVTIKNNTGTNLKMAAGKTSTISMPIPLSLQSTAPSTIPMWYYDTTATVWKEEGQATKIGNNYVGTVSHYTPWNLDLNFSGTTINGRVVDGEGNPIYYALVTADGSDYSGQSNNYTSTNGTFSVGVRANSTVKIKASKDGTESSISTVTSLTAGQSKNIGDIVLSAPIAVITLTWGEWPKDLDSHLIVPVYNSQGPGHVYWNNKGSAINYPFANLDTDDLYSYGPEVITIYKKLPGTFKYYVHNFSGEDTAPIASSNAKVTLLVNGQLYLFSVPVSNPNQYDTWRVFELIVSSSGSISINTLNDFKSSADVIPNFALRKK